MKRLLALVLLALPAALARAAQLPAPPPAEALVPGPLHSATNLAPAEERAALSSALPAPSESAVAAFLAPSGRDLPGFVSAGVWVDALALPVGLFETATPATVSSPSCSPSFEYSHGTLCFSPCSREWLERSPNAAHRL